MAKPDMIEKEEGAPAETNKDTRKPSDGEELSQSEQDQIAGGENGGGGGRTG